MHKTCKIMAKTSLIIFGILFLVITIFVTQIILTPAQKSDIQTANSLCNAEVNAFGIKVPIGSWGQKILGAEADCRKVHYYILIINYGWIGYVLGGLLLIGGFFSGETKNKRNIRRDKKGSFCGNCGNDLEGHEKHCPECGSKI